MPVRVNLFKHTANESLERTTGKQDSDLEPDDQTNGSINSTESNDDKRFQCVYSLFTEGFQFNL